MSFHAFGICDCLAVCIPTAVCGVNVYVSVAALDVLLGSWVTQSCWRVLLGTLAIGFEISPTNDEGTKVKFWVSCNYPNYITCILCRYLTHLIYYLLYFVRILRGVWFSGMDLIWELWCTHNIHVLLQSCSSNATTTTPYFLMILIVMLGWDQLIFIFDWIVYQNPIAHDLIMRFWH